MGLTNRLPSIYPVSCVFGLAAGGNFPADRRKAPLHPTTPSWKICRGFEFESDGKYFSLIIQKPLISQIGDP